VLAAGIVSGLVVVGALAGAVGAVDAPPGPFAGSLPSGTWIAFQFDSTSISFGGTVTLSVVSGSTASTADLWGAQAAWPGSWSTGGLSLNQLDPGPCTLALHPTQSCPFKVSGTPNTYQNLVFGLNLTPQQGQSFQQSVTLNPPPTPTTTPPPAPDSTFSGPGELTTPGSFTFRAPGQFGVTYTWTLFLNGAQADLQTGTAYTPPARIFGTPGTYTLRLTAANAVGQSEHEVSFVVAPPQQPSPPAPQPPPAASPQAPVGFHPTPAPQFTQVSFTPRLTDFATPKPGAVQPVTVIWLWRPDWFQSATQKPKTAGRPKRVTRAAVSVGSSRGGPSATPWLAGLATFGIFGAAWLAVRRRRVRTSIVD
jgi:hypothetical protein